MINYQVPIEGLKVSTNLIYVGTYWRKRKQIKDDIFSYATAFFRPLKKIKSYPVEIVYRFTFYSRGLDTLNCVFMAKMFEDSLVSLGVIEDDSPKYVVRSIIEVIDITAKEKKSLGKKGEDVLEITINEVEKLKI